MAVKHFSDFNGKTFDIEWTDRMPAEQFAKTFPGVKGLRYIGGGPFVTVGYTKSDNFGLIPLPVTRRIDFKREPSLHQCNAKCLNGKHNGTCECQCGGKNHGAGMFTKLVAEAA